MVVTPTPQHQIPVIPAKAGIHHRWQGRARLAQMDPCLRGGDGIVRITFKESFQ